MNYNIYSVIIKNLVGEKKSGGKYNLGVAFILFNIANGKHFYIFATKTTVRIYEGVVSQNYFLGL